MYEEITKQLSDCLFYLKKAALLPFRMQSRFLLR